MVKQNELTVIKKYANRRLYNTATSTYVTLEDLAAMVKREEDFTVVDAKSGQDITRAILTQIIFEEENKGTNLLPISFLRQLIRFYGDQMQALVPSFLETSLSSFTREQDKFREHMQSAFGGEALHMVEEQTRRNMKLFEQTLQMLNPFPERGATRQKHEAAGDIPQQMETARLSAMQKQLDDMQQQLEKLAGKKKD